MQKGKNVGILRTRNRTAELEQRKEELEKERAILVEGEKPKKTLDDVSKMVKTAYENFSERKGFDRRYEIPRQAGIYLVFRGSEILYVDSAENLQRRLKQLWSRPHTFRNKLLVELETIEMVRRFLMESEFIYRWQNIEEAELIERVLIYMRRPKYNDN